MLAYRVDILESERGYGQRIDSSKYFTGKNAKIRAEAFVKKYNATYNSENTVPDWYMKACTPVMVTEVPKKSKKK